MTRVLVTGATGFVGQVLCEVLAAAGYQVRAAVRGDRSLPSCVAESTRVGDIGAATEWSTALAGVDLVVHVAARVHQTSEGRSHPHLYAETNSLGSRSLADAAARAGVRRFIYLSTLKVNGEGSAARPYTTQDAPHPEGVYATSKWLAETSIGQVAASTGLETAIVRPPLVYGPGVRANFLRLMDWVNSGWPIPLGAIANRRSLVSVWNLCDLLLRLLTHPAAPGRVWMVSDGDDRSTADLIREIGRAMRRPVRLVPVPVGLLRAVGVLAGKGNDVSRLCNSLQVDITQTRKELGWSPPVALEEGVARTVAWYLSRHR
jgi:nucleoside-diphosphate-sugar epimerase